MLLSWSGSMFEYLMPLLVMPTYENTLLDQTYKAAVARQIEYGAQRGVPWGISESGYNTVDAHLNYQYRAFGVPGLGLKRGLADDLVIAPYASALALMVAPRRPAATCEHLAERRLRGDVRLLRSDRLHAVARAPRDNPRGGALVHGAPPGHESAGVRVSAAGPADAAALRVGSAVPGDHAAAAGARAASHGALSATSRRSSDVRAGRRRAGDAGARLRTPNTPSPEVQLLVQRPLPRDGHQRRRRLQPLEGSRGHALARRPHLRQLGHLLLSPRRRQRASSGRRRFSRRCSHRDSYEAIFSEARAEFRRRDRGFDTHTEIAVSPEDDIELRRISITNTSRSRKTIEVTSYAEVVLASAAGRRAASGVQQSVRADRDSARPAGDPVHAPPALARGAPAVDVPPDGRARRGGRRASYETDRMRFIGRGNTRGQSAGA